jgi:hypothetical protein
LTQSSTFDGPKVAPLVPASRLADRLLHVTLFVTTLSGILVFIEPSPYEASFALLLLACLAAGVTLDRRMLPLVLLLVILNVGGALSLVPVADNRKAVTYLAISAYLSMTAVVYACLFARDSVRRIATLRTAYILAAVIASLLGAAGYFKLFPGAEQFIEYGRARGTFKDPNVFAPFLILPLLFIVQRALLERLRIRHMIAGSMILMGLFLSFSRGAWAHFVGSALVMLLFLFLTAPNAAIRTRIVAFVVISCFAVAGLLAVLLSFSAVRTMFTERASLTQSYDVEHGGRFNTQAAGLRARPSTRTASGRACFRKYSASTRTTSISTRFFHTAGWAALPTRRSRCARCSSAIAPCGCAPHGRPR